MSIYAKIGGAPSVSVAVDQFYERVTADPSLAHYFEDVDLVRLKGHQRAFIGAALGGPETYPGRDMAAAHAGLGITADDFGRVVQHLAGTLTSLGVDDETVATIGEALAPLQDQIVTADAGAEADEPA
jgi:hemoglobin